MYKLRETNSTSRNHLLLSTTTLLKRGSWNNKDNVSRLELSLKTLIEIKRVLKRGVLIQRSTLNRIRVVQSRMQTNSNIRNKLWTLQLNLEGVDEPLPTIFTKKIGSSLKITRIILELLTDNFKRLETVLKHLFEYKNNLERILEPKNLRKETYILVVWSPKEFEQARFEAARPWVFRFDNCAEEVPALGNSLRKKY